MWGNKGPTKQDCRRAARCPTALMDPHFRESRFIMPMTRARRSARIRDSQEAEHVHCVLPKIGDSTFVLECLTSEGNSEKDGSTYPLIVSHDALQFV